MIGLRRWPRPDFYREGAWALQTVEVLNNNDRHPRHRRQFPGLEKEVLAKQGRPRARLLRRLRLASQDGEHRTQGAGPSLCSDLREKKRGERRLQALGFLSRRRTFCSPQVAKTARARQAGRFATL